MIKLFFLGFFENVIFEFFTLYLWFMGLGGIAGIGLGSGGPYWVFGAILFGGLPFVVLGLQLFFRQRRSPTTALGIVFSLLGAVVAIPISFALVYISIFYFNFNESTVYPLSPRGQAVPYVE